MVLWFRIVSDRYQTLFFFSQKSESEVKSYPQNQVGNLFEEAQERISPELEYLTDIFCQRRNETNGICLGRADSGSD